MISLVQAARIVMLKLDGKKLPYFLNEELSVLKVIRDKLFSILRANNMLIKPKIRYYSTTSSHHRFRKHKNLIRTLEIEGSKIVWFSDIPYLGTRKNLSCMALITDAYSKKTVGYNVSNSLPLKGSVDALEMALTNRAYKN